MKTLETNHIYSFKMTTGEEIVARLISVNNAENYMIIENPILVAITSKGLQMVPALFSSNMTENVKLNSNNWVMISETRDDIRDSWIEATTGIQTVSKKILTG